jgi:hypothetical protein
MKNQELKYNVYFEIEPMYYVSRLLGLAPFSFKKIKSGYTEVHFSHSDFILSTTLSVSLLVGLCLLYFVLANVVVTTFPILIRSLWFISQLAIYSTCIVTLILNITVHRKHFPLILRRICIIDSKLFNDGRNEKRYKSRRSVTTKNMAVIAIIWIISCVLCIYNLIHGDILNVLFSTLLILCKTIFFLISCQYTSMVLVLRARYKHLVSIYSNLRIRKDNLYDTNLTNTSISGPSGACFVLCANNRYFDVSQILEMQYINCQLYDVLWLVNKYYGIPVLLLLTTNVVSFIPSLFTVITLIKSVIVGEREFLYYMILSSNLCWCISILFTFVWIVSCCHLVTEEVQNLLLCIHTIQIHSNVRQSSVRELRSFISQLKDMKVEFSVCGLFALNLPFLFGTLGFISTYVTLLFQLQ